ncbi:STAS domain-containing protein [Kiloniella sp. EL199]|uniref:STAS domain-containing protein n=1 Tax=Kiloniella sp. EL199 TaxID=2107581 RepID=UPI000EA060C7|nr:STAS domain-containing protein [Kiloniella sp. EL199]
MDYAFSSDGTLLKCMLTGEFTFNDHPAFRGMIDEAVKTGAKSIQIDLADIEYIDSAGLGMFLVAQERAREEGWRFSISNPREKVEKMFTLAKLGTIVTIIKD